MIGQVYIDAYIWLCQVDHAKVRMLNIRHLTARAIARIGDEARCAGIAMKEMRAAMEALRSPPEEREGKR